MKAVEQLLCIRLAIEVDVGVGMAVPGQKFLHPESACAVRRTDEDGIPVAAGNHLDTPENECPHEDFAQLCIGLYKREQLFASQLDNVARLFNPRQSERGTAGDRAGFPGELARPERNDQQLELAAEAHGIESHPRGPRRMVRGAYRAPRSTSPTCVVLRRPCAAMRSTWLADNVGNSRSSRDGSRAGAVSVSATVSKVRMPRTRSGVRVSEKHGVQMVSLNQ